MTSRSALLIALLATVFSFAVPSRAATVTYTSQGPHQLRDSETFEPLILNVANLVEPVSEITVTFSTLIHSHPADIDALLVGPAGQNVMLMSDVGELLSEAESMINQVTFTFRDGAARLPENVRLTSGTYAPTNYQGIVEEIPEMDQTAPSMPPAGPYGTMLSVFNGSDPNGTWKLYTQDDLEDEAGELGSWSLTVTTVPEPSSALLLVAGANALLFRRPRIA